MLQNAFPLRRPHWLSAFLLLSFLSLPACATHSRWDSSGPEAHRLLLAVEQRYPAQKLSRAQAQLCTAYFGELSWRLKSAFSNAGRPLPYAIQIQLTSDTQPLALSPGPGLIVLSTGLVRALPSEAALAFVVAHEMAHHAYGQLLELQALGSEEQIAPIRLQQWERSADHLALGVVAMAGFDPRHALLALNTGYQSLAPEALALDSQGKFNDNSLLHSHPSQRERSSTIRAEIQAAHWRGPAIETRRVFRKLQESLGK